MFTQSFEELSIKTNGNKLIKLTEKVLNFVDCSKILNGILNISIFYKYKYILKIMCLIFI